MAKKSSSYRRYRRNPFGVSSINQLAIKVAGGVAGGVAAATIPNMVSPSLGSGWGGVGMALAIAFGGSYVLKSSATFSEGVLIGGVLQAVGRATQILMGKNLVSFSLSGYGPLTFPTPTPGYNARVTGGQAVATVPVGPSQGKPMMTRGGTSPQALSGTWRRGGVWSRRAA
jgi:hypothetical protein